jgi:ubiquinone/menaquinone biosynthesis C-methylase UbiE
MRFGSMILDACCGGRMMWFDKNDDRAIFADVRAGDLDVSHCTQNPGRKSVQPDIFSDFTQMAFPDDSFWHVVYDPPHVRGISMESVTGFSYGSLDKESWRGDLANGFSECFRVLKPNGTLIFKWNEVDIALSEVLALAPYEPLYGHRSGRAAKTHWVAFIKPSAAGEI